MAVKAVLSNTPKNGASSFSLETSIREPYIREREHIRVRVYLLGNSPHSEKSVTYDEGGKLVVGHSSTTKF